MNLFRPNDDQIRALQELAEQVAMELPDITALLCLNTLVQALAYLNLPGHTIFDILGADNFARVKTINHYLAHQCAANYPLELHA